MISLEYFICGEQIIVDSFSNEVSVISIIQEIKADHFPIILPRFSFIASFAKIGAGPDVIDGTARFSMGEAVLFEGSVRLDFQGSTRSRAILKMNGLIIPSVGKVDISVQFPDVPVMSWVIEAEQLSPPLLQQLNAPAQAPQGQNVGAEGGQV